MQEGEKGKGLPGLSYSPEHGPFGISDCPFDSACVRYTFETFIRTAQILGVDREMAGECRRAEALLADCLARIQSGRRIVADRRDGPHVPVHNITVPPVFPCDQVNPVLTGTCQATLQGYSQGDAFQRKQLACHVRPRRRRLSMPRPLPTPGSGSFPGNSPTDSSSGRGMPMVPVCPG